jgi:exopolyphosphatase/guanosine-5'-triphosphate,3'-diphosphate pyrophosphatase
MRAVISLGTNTARLLVVRDGDGGSVEQIEHRQTGTRLGEGLREAGSLLPAAVDRTLAAVRDFTARVRAYGAELSCIATSAMRRASDAGRFAERMREITGVPLHVLDGGLEARASYLGATYGAAHDGCRTAVLDIGGGSTELAVGRDGLLLAATSIEIGSVRVSEMFPELCGTAPGEIARAAAVRARLAIDVSIEPFRELLPVERVRCVAGTPLTLAAIAMESHVDRVSGQILTRRMLEATLERLLGATLEERRALPGMLAQRADILVGGGLILAASLHMLGVEEALLEANDLLLGYLLLQRNSGALPKTE